VHLASFGHRIDETPQTEQADPREIVNNAGGYVFPVDAWMRLERWIVLGSEKPTYYATAQTLTKENAKHVAAMIEKHGVAVVERVVDISVAGRAAKQEYGIFVLAMCAGAKDVAVRQAALAALPEVCRTGSTLLLFASYVKQFRGWGPTLRKGIARWYDLQRVADRLAYQVVKYQNRYGWTHRDLLRKAHPNPIAVPEREFSNIIEQEPRGAGEGSRYTLTSERDRLYAWVTRKEHPSTVFDLPLIVRMYERAHASQEVDWEALDLLTHEMIPTEWKRSADVWERLLQKMPLTAMIRNLASMTVAGALNPGSTGAQRVVAALGDAEHIRRSRVHPAAILTALATYRGGKGLKGKLTWIPTPEIVAALDAAFYLAFPNVVPAGKRFLVGLDVSGSMSTPMTVLPSLSAREATTALAMILMETEPHVEVYGFTCSSSGRWSRHDAEFLPIPMHKGQRLADVMQFTQNLPFGGTDCALPMVHATKNRIPVDCFLTLTDNETWAGPVHPMEALRTYRREMGIPAKLAVVGTTATQFSIADTNDAGALDLIGFDANLPVILNNFARGTSAPRDTHDEAEE
jgi:60 kDa SS-A/Ro ribonucleoprotein